MLAEKLGWVFLEADTFHSVSNIEKMRSGVHLNDADRMPWLDAIHSELLFQDAAGENVVLACSALKENYRRRLARGLDVKVIYLKGIKEAIAKRIGDRKGHFAGVAILDDQFSVLEEPQNALLVNALDTPEKIVSEILQKI